MQKCGLLGKTLAHSFSPFIHSRLGNYEYRLYEKKEKEIGAFLRSGDFSALNVTIPYKKTVIPFLDELSPEAEKIGSVNTIVKSDNGKLTGYNTDYYGFIDLLSYNGISVKGKKVLILGNGGASVAVAAAIEDLGGEYVVISRTGENNYGNINRHYDARGIVNATPVGMFPNNYEKIIDIDLFHNLESVVDIIYNPLQTALLAMAKEKGIKTANGLYMLVSQAKRSAELFTKTEINNETINGVYKKLLKKMQNIVLIGMPGCGKTAVAGELEKLTGKQTVDTDCVITERIKMPISEYFAKYGEEAFRETESAVLCETGKRTGIIISTGGGCVKRKENYFPLCQNGVIIYIKRDINLLERQGRPLSLGADLEEMYKQRAPLYETFADITVNNDKTVRQTAEKILEEIS